MHRIEIFKSFLRWDDTSWDLSLLGFLLFFHKGNVVFFNIHKSTSITHFIIGTLVKLTIWMNFHLVYELINWVIVIL